MEGSQGLQMVWQLLDQALRRLAHERLDEACAAWYLARRRHGKRMHERIVYPKRTQLEMAAEDENTIISNKQTTSKMEVARAVQLCSTLIAIQTVPGVMFPKIHEIEKMIGQAVPSTNRTSRPKPLMRKPSAGEVFATEVESDQEQDATEERAPEMELSRKMNFWETPRKTTATVQTRKCVVPPKQHSLLVGVPSRRWRISGERKASRKRR